MIGPYNADVTHQWHFCFKPRHPRKAKIVHLHSSQGKVYNSTVCTLLVSLKQWVKGWIFSKQFCVGMGQEEKSERCVLAYRCQILGGLVMMGKWIHTFYYYCLVSRFHWHTWRSFSFNWLWLKSGTYFHRIRGTISLPHFYHTNQVNVRR